MYQDRYFVVGGVWETTEFKKLVDKVVRQGPMSYERAKDVWRGLAQNNVDDAHHRVFVVDDTVVDDFMAEAGAAVDA